MKPLKIIIISFILAIILAIVIHIFIPKELSYVVSFRGYEEGTRNTFFGDAVVNAKKFNLDNFRQKIIDYETNGIKLERVIITSIFLIPN